MKPNGIAILPVPVIVKKTIEYPAPNPNEANHVRAPGYDYWDRISRKWSDEVKNSLIIKEAIRRK